MGKNYGETNAEAERRRRAELAQESFNDYSKGYSSSEVTPETSYMINSLIAAFTGFHPDPDTREREIATGQSFEPSIFAKWLTRIGRVLFWLVIIAWIFKANAAPYLGLNDLYPVLFLGLAFMITGYVPRLVTYGFWFFAGLMIYRSFAAGTLGGEPFTFWLSVLGLIFAGWLFTRISYKQRKRAKEIRRAIKKNF
jgi:hypothetical protein